MKFDLAAAMDIIYKIILKAKLNEISNKQNISKFSNEFNNKKIWGEKKNDLKEKSL